MTISAFPPANPLQLLSLSSSVRAWLGTQSNCFPSGTESLYWAFRGLGVGPGVLVHLPSFHCGIEVQAALDCGAEVRFYATHPDLTHDVDMLERNLRACPGPVVIIHYFGFPQPALGRIAALCRELQVPWIADCAHALFSSAAATPPPAPVSIFSLHKTLGIFDGGTLQLNPAVLVEYTPRPFCPPDPGRFYSRPYFTAAKAFVRCLVGEQLTRVYRHLRYRHQQPPAPPTHADEPFVPHPVIVVPYGRRMSALSRRLASTHNAERIAAARRAHYTLLAQALAQLPGFDPVFPTLPPGVCPLVLPIRVKSRPRVRAALLTAGIEPFVFGEYLHPAVPPRVDSATLRLRAEILGLPVHQLLTGPDLERIASTLAPFLRQPAPEAVPASPLPV